jgi:hypothetical protein
MVWHRVDQDCSTEDSHLECGVEFEASVSISAVAATVVVLGVLIILVIGAFLSFYCKPIYVLS